MLSYKCRLDGTKGGAIKIEVLNMSGESGPLYVKIGRRTQPVNLDSNVSAVVLQSGTREAGTLADAFAIEGAANASTSKLVKLVNASHAQNSKYTIQDSGQATANVNVSGTLVIGNVPQASTTGGYLVDSGIPAANLVQSTGGAVSTISVTMLTAAVTTAFATPVQLIAAPGAGKLIMIQEASVYTASTGNTAYATGTSPVIQYDSTVHGAGTAATSALATGDITAASSQIKFLTFPTGALTGITNKGIFFSNATNNYTAGTGTNIVITLTYQVVTATV